jgi:carboxypeptidase Taq
MPGEAQPRGGRGDGDGLELMSDTFCTAWDQLRAHLHTTQLLGGIHSTLYFDQNTAMPAAAAGWRGEQLAVLAQQLHERQTNPAYQDLLAAAEQALPVQAPAEQRHNLHLLKRELARQSRLEPALVGAIAQAQAEGYSRWQEAKQRNDFDLFAPALQRLIELRLEQAQQLAPVEIQADGRARSAWEILAQPFEPDISKQQLTALLLPLRELLPPLLERARSLPLGSSEAWDLSEAQQESLCADLLQNWGYNQERCQRAHSPHPFSCTLGPDDFRITTRVVEGQPFSAFLATAHEWGHSLYEQGLPRSGEHWFPWPLGEATSMAVHESQSLFYENRLGRSQALARRWHPRFTSALGRDVWGSPQAFWRDLNPIRAGLTRVEADEVSYGLHVLLRYELELALVEGGMPVAELPEAWNRGMQELLSVKPANDAQGCLQDVHWSEGLFGYFPSYALGHLISAQLSDTLEQELGAIESLLEAGRDAELGQWLQTRVYPLGRSVNAAELVEYVSGQPLSPEPFGRYLHQKLERLEG